LIQRADRKFGIFTARHPEWWILGVSAAAWSWLFFGNLRSGRGWMLTGNICGTLGSRGTGIIDLPGGLASWFFMVLAMMLPLIIFPVRAAAFGSLWRRRNRAICVFLGGYLAVWMSTGVANLLALIVVRGIQATDSRWAVCTGFLAAAGWQMTSLKRRFFSACHMTKPLAPDGWRAHRDCLYFGVDHGIHCVGNCGLLMLASTISPWHNVIMAFAAVILIYERYLARPTGSAVAVTLGLLALGHLVC
jgi:predicted metal-binding membrane protein